MRGRVRTTYESMIRVEGDGREGKRSWSKKAEEWRIMIDSEREYKVVEERKDEWEKEEEEEDNGLEG